MDRDLYSLQKRITPDDSHYFFGYFDKFPWNNQGVHLAHRVDFAGRQPLFGEKAALGILDNGKFVQKAETAAWCWQQGTMLQWFDNDRFIFNDIDVKKFHYISRLSDGSRFEMPIYTLSPDRRYALSLNFARLDRERAGYGYPGLPDAFEDYAFPENDGIWLMDLNGGENKLIVPLSRLVDEFPAEGADKAVNWVNHLLFSPDGKRISFLHRWRVFGPWGRGYRSYVTRMFTCNVDGTDLRMLNIDFHASHYTWRSADELIVFSRIAGDSSQYRIYRVGDDDPEVFARDRLPADGHCSFSPDGKLLLTDSYTDRNGNRELVVYDWQRDIRYSLGFFYSPGIVAPSRCDLHPRWSQDGKKISFDSYHEKIRGIYQINLPEEVLC